MQSRNQKMWGATVSAPAGPAKLFFRARLRNGVPLRTQFMYGKKVGPISTNLAHGLVVTLVSCQDVREWHLFGENAKRGDT
jgi:hypothetical protein